MASERFWNSLKWRGTVHRYLRSPYLRFLLVLCCALLVALGGMLLSITADKPQLLVNPASGSRLVVDRKERTVALTLASDERYRLWTPLSEISPLLIAATLEYEDRWFYYHPGFNPWALIRGAAATYLHQARRTGGSTITMQLARLRYGIDSRSVWGKVTQIWRAVVLECTFSKDEILEAYLNLAPYGQNIEGIGAASQIYFGVPAARLSPEQSVTLAVVPQNPSRRSPARSKGVDPALLTTRQALGQRLALALPASFASLQLDLPLSVGSRAQIPQRALHAVRALVQTSHSAARIESTLDLDVQTVAERALEQFLERYRPSGITNGAIIVSDWRSGELLAYVGSADFHNSVINGQVDGTRARRSPGSALKPFLYGVALEQGKIHPLTLLKDTPRSFAAYDPENFDRAFVGPISAQAALVRSRNVPAVELANSIDADGFYQLLRKAGIGRLRSSEYYGLALTLGGVEVTLQELVRLYSMLAARGEYRALVLEQDTKAARSQENPIRLLSPESAYLTLSMLAQNPRPEFGSTEEDPAHERGDLPVAWKTGTSFGFRDAWAIGVLGEYTVGVWLGNFSGIGNPALIGREAAGRLLFRVTDALRARAPLEENPLASTALQIARVEVCSESGAIPTDACPHRRTTLFIPGVSPIAPCTIHRKIGIEPVSGLRACSETLPQEQRVYEFWPSDLLELFSRAGLPRKVPPPFEPSCRADAAALGVIPVIVSPEPAVVYQLSLRALPQSSPTTSASNTTSTQELQLRAISDADASALYWFINEVFVGKVEPQKPLSWPLRPGTFTARVVDDRGRGASRTFRVDAVN